jgi:hypothetical protein
MYETAEKGWPRSNRGWYLLIMLRRVFKPTPFSDSVFLAVGKDVGLRCHDIMPILYNLSAAAAELFAQK